VVSIEADNLVVFWSYKKGGLYWGRQFSSILVL
jgi:hypothetical protein